MILSLHQAKSDLSIVIKPQGCGEDELKGLYGRFGVCDENGLSKEIIYDIYAKIIDKDVLDAFNGHVLKQTILNDGVEATEFWGLLRYGH
jgi:hypothetical protein